MQPGDNFKWNRVEGKLEATAMVHERCATDPQAEIATEAEVRMVLENNPGSSCGVCGKRLQEVLTKKDLQRISFLQEEAKRKAPLKDPEPCQHLCPTCGVPLAAAPWP